MLETPRQNSIVSYGGQSKAALLTLAKQAFAQADFVVPERFASFLPLFPFELIQNMSYVGRAEGRAAKVSALGYSCDPQEYHLKMHQQQPGLYKGDNYRRNFDYEGRFQGRGVFTVDAAWVSFFPQFSPFMGEKLMIHLIGGGHQAVALPESLSPRSCALLRNVEKSLQLTQRAEQFAHYVKTRVKAGDAYDPEVFGADYLTSTGLSPVMLRQNELGRILQDLSIARSLQSDQGSAGLFTESAKRVENLNQYVPFLYACDAFETTDVTRHTARLFQPCFQSHQFISDFWLPYQDLGGYLNRETMTLDMARLCEGYQIAPVYDPGSRGGRYPDSLRVIVVRDRELSLMVSDVLSNPAYGSGMNPLGMIGKQVFILDSQELLRQRKLALEETDIVVENTCLSSEAYLRAVQLSAFQEFKGNLVDAMYRREAALSQLTEGTRPYERAKNALDEKVQALQKQVLLAGSLWKHGQVSGYDADIDYLRRKQLDREGLPEDDPHESIAFSPDPQREQSIESGYAMRNNARRMAYQDAYLPPPREEPSSPALPQEESPLPDKPPENLAVPESTPLKPSPEAPPDAAPLAPAASEAAETPAEEALVAEPPAEEAPAAPDPPAEKTASRSQASFQDLTHKLVTSADPSAPKLAYIVRRDSEPKIAVNNKAGKMAALPERKPKEKP